METPQELEYRIKLQEQNKRIADLAKVIKALVDDDAEEAIELAIADPLNAQDGLYAYNQAVENDVKLETNKQIRDCADRYLFGNY